MRVQIVLIRDVRRRWRGIVCACTLSQHYPPPAAEMTPVLVHVPTSSRDVRHGTVFLVAILPFLGLALWRLFFHPAANRKRCASGTKTPRYRNSVPLRLQSRMK